MPHKLARCFAFLLFALVLGPTRARAEDPSPAELVLRTVSIPRPVHFVDGAGGDVLVPAGAYWVDSADELLQLLSLDSGASYSLRATVGQHAERLDRSVALSTAGTEDQPDVHVLMLLFAGGTRLTAEGSYSGVQQRGLLGDAKKKAEAARQSAAAAALAAKEKARNKANEALARAKEVADELRATLEGFRSLPCEQKIEVVLQAADAAAGKLQLGPERPPAENALRRRILDEIVEKALRRNPEMLWKAVQLMAAIRNGKQEGRIQSMIQSAACGTDPEATQAEFIAIVDSLAASIQPLGGDSKSAVQARSVPVFGRLFDRAGYSVSFDISVSGAFPISRRKALGFGEGLGIAGGTVGNSTCPMPHGDGKVGIRSYYYRYVGRSTLELGGGVPLSVSIWAVNPRDLAGRFTMIGATISAESIGVLIGAGTGTATAASGGAASPSLLATLVGFVGFGIDLTFDQSMASYVECALQHPDTWATDCTELPNLVGVTVSGGFSASLAPVAAHTYGGAEWTWWWDPRVYDPQGPAPLFPLIKDAVQAKLSGH